jgi:hypothetical protein
VFQRLGFAITRSALLCALILFTTNEAIAASRLGEAEVRDDNGVPCFSINKNEEHRAGIPALGSLSVDDATSKPNSRIWSFRFKPLGRSQAIGTSDCIRYGEAPAGSEITKVPEPLQAGKVYEVFLNASSSDTGDPTFGYDATFCLIPQANGTKKVQQIVYSDGWHFEICTP